MAHIKQFEHLKIQLDAITLATKNFANDSCIGKGGFGKVYKGDLVYNFKSHTVVAFKRLDRNFGQGDPEFWKEIMMLSFYRHENIVSLLGYCDDHNEKILVYEYASKRSLDLYLNSKDLSWVQRLKICIGAARGLAYLHSPMETQLRVIHRDIKSSNILLDEKWKAMISDFGLSKFSPANQKFTFLVSNAVGTIGYCDPLYVETGLLTKESDVYSFGVVLFEVLCGRLCIDNNDKHLPLIRLVRQCYKDNTLNEIIFKDIKDEIDPRSLKEFIEIAYQCLKKHREERPLMTEVVKALENALECQNVAVGGDQGTHIAGILKVKIMRGMKLTKRNPYVIIKLTNSNVTPMRKTSVKHKSVNPEWNEEFTLYIEDPNTQDLEIWVQNKASVEMDDIVGMTDLELRRLKPVELYTQTHYIHNMGESQGNIMIEVLYIPFTYYTTFEDVCPLQKAPIGTPKCGGSLGVIIHEGKDLIEKHHNNPFVSLLFQGELRGTVSIKKTNDPIWEEEFIFTVEEPPMHEELLLEVISTPWRELIYREEESMGYANISLADIVNKKRILQWYNLINGENGQLRVELQWRIFD